MVRSTVLSLAFCVLYIGDVWAQEAEPAPEEPAPTEQPAPPTEPTATETPKAAPVVTKDADGKSATNIYGRSQTTVKAGQYMGIGGPGLMVVGGVVMLSSGITALQDGAANSEGDSSYVPKGSGGVLAGGVMVGLGYGAYSTGPALIAGGSIRQNKAIRMRDSSAPKPALGYTTWGIWGAGRALIFFPNGAGVALLTDVAAYITGSLQYSKNRLAWERLQHDAVGKGPVEHQRPKVTVNVAPIVVNGAQGFALAGTF